MAFVKVEAILRTTCVDRVEKARCDIQVPGVYAAMDNAIAAAERELGW